MGISLRPERLRRYRDIARLLVKYGRSDLVRHAELDAAILAGGADGEAAPPEAEELARDLEALGPTYVKLGQLLSTRADLLPVSYLAALTRLQDDVEPFAFAAVEAIVEEELGVRLSRAFQSFDPVPLAAASLGQVHRAALRDGRAVVVKVQRPGIRDTIVEDLDTLEELTALLDQKTELGERYDLPGMLAEFRRSLLRELDYRQEARNLARMRENLKGFERIVVPRPVADLTTGRVLTMEYVSGRKVTALSPLTLTEVDGRPLADELFAAYMKQILVDGFFHADPHPGNLFLTDDGRLALLDLGMVGRLGPALQRQLLKLLIAVSEGDGDLAADLAREIGTEREHFDEPRFRREVADFVGRVQGATAAELEVGRVVLAVARASGESGIVPPVELTMVGKALLDLDAVSRTLDPDFDPNASVRRHAGETLRRRMLHSLSPGNVATRALELNEFVEHLPERLNRALDTVAENRLELRLRDFDEHRIIAGMQRIANRITLGLVLAALIVGAAMLMQVETSFRILGYPGLAILLFLAAALGGVLLILDIVRHDE